MRQSPANKSPRGGRRVGAGRPSSGKDEHLHLRIHPDVKRALQAAADEQHESLSEYVLAAALERAGLTESPKTI